MPAMKFGLHYLLSCAEEQNPATRYADTLEQASWGDELGFESVWPVEHHFNRALSILPSPFMLLSAIAARTQRIRLGTAVVQLPLAHPLRVAEEAAMLDVMSGGRLELGVGRGSNPAHFGGLGVDLAESRDRLVEGLELLRRAWTEPSVTFEGRFHSARDVSLALRPLQLPHPRVHVAVNGDDTLDFAAAAGYPVLIAQHVNPLPRLRELVRRYRAGRRAAGHPAVGSEDISVLMPLFVAPTRGDVERATRPSVARYLELVRGELLPLLGRCTVEAERRRLQAIIERMAATRYEDIDGSLGVFDTPEGCVEQLRQLKEELGVGRVIGWFNFGGLVPHADVMQSMKLFAARVMPHL